MGRWGKRFYGNDGEDVCNKKLRFVWSCSEDIICNKKEEENILKPIPIHFFKKKTKRVKTPLIYKWV